MINEEAVYPITPQQGAGAHASRVYPFGEDEILALQDLFLTPGCHTITAYDIRSGRIIISNMLESLNYYQHPSVLTQSDIAVEPNIGDVYQNIFQSTVMSSSINERIEQYLLEEFYADFMWIETSKELLEQSWYDHFQECLQEYNIDQHLSIVSVLYDQ